MRRIFILILTLASIPVLAEEAFLRLNRQEVVFQRRQAECVPTSIYNAYALGNESMRQVTLKNKSMHAIQSAVEEAKAKGSSLREVAELAHQMRRDVGQTYKNQTPFELRRQIYERNFSQYGDELGPSFEFLVAQNQAQGKSSEVAYRSIIETSTKSNVRLNKFIDTLEKVLQ